MVLSPNVPRAICKVKASPSHQTPRAAPKRGEVELSVLERVGPKNFVAATEKLAESDGLKTPTKTNINTADLKK